MPLIMVYKNEILIGAAGQSLFCRFFYGIQLFGTRTLSMMASACFDPSQKPKQGFGARKDKHIC